MKGVKGVVGYTFVSIDKAQLGVNPDLDTIPFLAEIQASEHQQAQE